MIVRDARCRGAILLQVAFLLLVIMGIGALVVDLGMARASQVFMQTSSDVAALEGLRYRDAAGTPEQRELLRRSAAVRVAALVYDEDLNLDTDPLDYSFGAGPVFETGVGGVDDPAGGLLVQRGPYVPRLELNEEDNLVYGDLVAGSYLAVDPLAPGNPDWHEESGDYSRADFEASSIAAAGDATAFLVRHRRTRRSAPLDRLPGVSSAGPTVPFLFGLGSGVLTTRTPEVYDPRRDGLTVRATTIAAARPVLSVGLARTNLLGAVEVGTDASNPAATRVLALSDATWRTEVNAGDLFQVEVREDGSIAGASTGPTPGLSGRALSGPGPWSVGQRFSAIEGAGAVDLSLDGLQLGEFYIALYRVDGPQVVVTGFASADLQQFSLATIGTELIVLVEGVKRPAQIARENASGVPSTAEDLTELLPPASNREALLAPVLVR